MSYVTQMQTMGVLPSQHVQQHYGISAESLQDIQQHAGATTQQRTQIVVSEEKDVGQTTLAQSQLIIQLKEALEYQAMQFERFRDLSERKFTTLSKDLLDVTMQLKQSHQIVMKLKDKEDAIAARAALNQYQQGDRRPVNQAIDRTGVAPADVRINDIFNCSGKRF